MKLMELIEIDLDALDNEIDVLNLENELGENNFNDDDYYENMLENEEENDGGGSDDNFEMENAADGNGINGETEQDMMMRLLDANEIEDKLDDDGAYGDTGDGNGDNNDLSFGFGFLDITDYQPNAKFGFPGDFNDNESNSDGQNEYDFFDFTINGEFGDDLDIEMMQMEQEMDLEGNELVEQINDLEMEWTMDPDLYDLDSVFRESCYDDCDLYDSEMSDYSQSS